jgi:hypothetical protein
MTIKELPSRTFEELHLTGADNFNSLLLVTIEFLKQHELSLTDYVLYVGSRFAAQWPAGLSPLQVAEGMASNFMSVGAKVEELAGDENEAYCVMSGWPSAGVLLRYSGKEEEVDLFLLVSRPIAERQNCVFEIERQDDRVICKYKRVV